MNNMCTQAKTGSMGINCFAAQCSVCMQQSSWHFRTPWILAMQRRDQTEEVKTACCLKMLVAVPLAAFGMQGLVDQLCQRAELSARQTRLQCQGSQQNSEPWPSRSQRLGLSLVRAHQHRLGFAYFRHCDEDLLPVVSIFEAVSSSCNVVHGAEEYRGSLDETLPALVYDRHTLSIAHSKSACVCRYGPQCCDEPVCVAQHDLARRNYCRQMHSWSLRSGDYRQRAACEYRDQVPQAEM